MTDLFQYLGHDIALVDTDGVEWYGHVRAYTSVLDSEDEEEEIALRTDKGLIGFRASEIKKIEYVANRS